MSKPTSYIVDRVLHWASAFLVMFMYMNMGTMIHNVNYELKGQLEHRQDAIESHAIQGVILVTLLVFRLFWSWRHKGQLVRSPMKSTAHKWFVNIAHIALYIVLLALPLTGLIMTINSDIPLSILGFNFPVEAVQQLGAYTSALDIHLWLISTLGWIIGLHFVGALYAKR